MMIQGHQPGLGSKRNLEVLPAAGPHITAKISVTKKGANVKNAVVTEKVTKGTPHAVVVASTMSTASKMFKAVGWPNVS